ncbi:MAG: GntR family transcriptional regulator [Rhodospirillaceae bacterium]|nr:GntR family transcriptional regulator [Rhodospirillaceae bacterium]MCA8932723.1 GntR family transcriptional regulator [Rhodospirillaceae bacterium]
MRRDGSGVSGASPRLYQRAYDILARQIEAGEIAPGERLLEAQVTARFGISRAPARKALAELACAGLIEKAAGRGYTVVGLGGAPSAPALPSAPGERVVLSSPPTWERIYGEVEREIAGRSSFAGWRVIEAKLAEHYGVSRTVARDVLGRLQQRGVVRKDERSRWYAPALSPTYVSELYELRWVLEPVALAKAAANAPPGLLARMHDSLEATLTHPRTITGETLDRLEEDLHITLLGHCGNLSLMQAITLPQSLLIAHRFLYGWNPRLFETEPFLQEHLAIVDRLAAGKVAEAAATLEAHLKVSRDRAIARIDVVGKQFNPESLPYLERIAGRT